MKISKIISTLLLCLSIALAGFPVQAKHGCPMAKSMQKQDVQQMDMKDCNGCGDMPKQEQKKSDCCDDATCNAKCSAMNSDISMNLPVTKAEISTTGNQTLLLYPADTAIVSAHLSNQERPPKSLP